MQNKSRLLIVGAFIVLLSGCRSSIAGTYSDAQGAVILELRSGGSANFTWMGEMLDCSYETGGKKLTLNCKGDTNPTVFNIHDDGSLSGPPGSFMPPMRKQK